MDRPLYPYLPHPVLEFNIENLIFGRPWKIRCTANKMHARIKLLGGFSFELSRFIKRLDQPVQYLIGLGFVIHRFMFKIGIFSKKRNLKSYRLFETKDTLEPSFFGRRWCARRSLIRQTSL